MKILFASNSFPIPPRNGIELTLASHMEYFAKKNEVAFALLYEDIYESSEIERSHLAPEWLRNIYKVKVSRPRLLGRIFEEICLYRPTYYAWDYDANEIKKLFLSKSFDIIFASPVGLGSFSDAFKKYVSSKPKIVLGINDAIYYSYFERGTAFFRGRDKFNLASVGHLIRSPLILFHESKYLRRVDAIHVQTAFERKRVEKILFKKKSPDIIVAQIGIKKELLKMPYTENIKNILFMTHLNGGREYQALWFLQNVWPEVKKYHQEANIKVVGTPAPPKLSEYLNNIPGVVQCGFAKDLYDAYRNAAISVIPIFQSSGIIIRALDSMAAGVPVVGSRQALQTMEGFIDGFHGMAASNKEEMVQKIIHLLDDEKKRRELSVNSRRYVSEKFTWSHAFNAMESAFEKLLSQN